MPSKPANNKLTVKEQFAIEGLQKVANSWPDSLIIQTNDGESDEDGPIMVMKEDPKCPGAYKEVSKIYGIKHLD